MAAALSLLTIVALAIVLVRIGSVTLRLTGLPPHVARFQALSAFTGTGFTTGEATLVVNHPDRRRVISILMILGNGAIVSTISALVLTHVDFEATRENLIEEGIWLAGVVFAIWLLGFNKWVERNMVGVIMWVLEHMTGLVADGTTSLLVLDDEYHVVEIKVGTGSGLDSVTFTDLRKATGGVVPLAVLHQDGTLFADPHDDISLANGDILIVYGRIGALAKLRTDLE